MSNFMSGTAYRSLFGLVFLAGLTFGIFTASAFSWNVPDDTNVNSRYTVERIDLSGVPESKRTRNVRPTRLLALNSSMTGLVWSTVTPASMESTAEAVLVRSRRILWEVW